MYVGQIGGGRAAWVRDDEGAAVALHRDEMRDERRHGLGHVAADEQHGSGSVEVGQRERQAAVDAERPVTGRGRGRHAVPAVVVDVPRP